MEKILSITRKLGISFYALLSAAASSKFIQSTKAVLIKFCALGVVKRMWLVISHIGIGIGAILFVAAFIVGIFATFIFGGIIIAIEIILLIPYCIIWLLTGKWWFWNIMTYLYDETILFELMKIIDLNAGRKKFY